ncbi:MAG TPA: preprotein translocase subunit YajC [Polyangiaceae bacterium LLY-WYZ-15_(1-7)]|nr:preprotein translocase subunit YajC [Myxococcales bacterium]MAT28073.1 preprotein translocase subunit YajC [Sandaracinus sp.]HJK89495.1 preprotein translocase subunit YajC [Polyangiaceae bacterium LLY-WYZ-15_(1-7)]HJL04012.1 preprotein translocase subunit YajC [Polyangiaceae bacterium LLY-WYZ-15_(1-7)]HJL10550.1 preprotein translocase subunit YajC [Polyangiaceae bacterium LLY-WYZ-15_(1-7)]
MYLSFLQLLTTLALWQPEAAAGGGGGGAGGGAAGGAPPGGCAAGGMNLGLLAVMFLVFYFLIIRPQQKRQREHEEMLGALRKGMTVRTTGGIRGEIVDIDEREVTLRVADKTKINVLRSHVSGPDGASDKDDAKKD